MCQSHSMSLSLYLGERNAASNKLLVISAKLEFYVFVC